MKFTEEQKKMYKEIGEYLESQEFYKNRIKMCKEYLEGNGDMRTKIIFTNPKDMTRDRHLNLDRDVGELVFKTLLKRYEEDLEFIQSCLDDYHIYKFEDVMENT